MEEIEYLEEYEDLILPTINSNSSVVQSTRSMPNMASAQDDEDSSSIDQDIFESLFDGQSDDDNILQKDPKLCSQLDDRVSLDSLDMLVKDLVGGRLSPPETTAQKVAITKKVPSTLPPARTSAKGHSTPNAMRPITSLAAAAASKQKMTSKSDSSSRHPTNKSKSIATVRPTMQNQHQNFTSTNIGISRSSTPASSASASVTKASGSFVMKSASSSSVPKTTSSSLAASTASSSFASKPSSSFAAKASSSFAAKASSSFAAKASSSFPPKISSSSSVSKAPRKLNESSSVTKHSSSSSRKQISAATSTTNETETSNVQRKNNRPQPTIIKPEKTQTRDPAEDPLSLEGICDDIDSDSDSLTLSDISGDSFASLSDLDDIPRNIIDISNDSSYEKNNLEKIRGETPSPTVSDIDKNDKNTMSSPLSSSSSQFMDSLSNLEVNASNTLSKSEKEKIAKQKVAEFLASDDGAGTMELNDLARNEESRGKVTIISDTLLTRIDEAIKDTPALEEQNESKELTDKEDANIDKVQDDNIERDVDGVEHEKTSVPTAEQKKEQTKTIGITITATLSKIATKSDEKLENETDGVKITFIETNDKGNVDEKAKESESTAEKTIEVDEGASAKDQIVNSEETKSHTEAEEIIVDQGKLDEKSEDLEKSNEISKDIEKSKEKCESNEKTKDEEKSTNTEKCNEKSNDIEIEMTKVTEKSKNIEGTKSEVKANDIPKDNNKTKEKPKDMDNTKEKSKNIETSKAKSKHLHVRKHVIKTKEKSKEKDKTNEKPKETEKSKSVEETKMQGNSKNVEKSKEKSKDIEKTPLKTKSTQPKLENSKDTEKSSKELTKDIVKTPQHSKSTETMKVQEKSKDKSKDIDSSKEKSKTTSKSNSAEAIKVHGKPKDNSKDTDKSKDIEKSREKSKSSGEIKLQEKSEKDSSNVDAKVQEKTEAIAKHVEKSKPISKDIEIITEEFKGFNETKEKEISTTSSKHIERSNESKAGEIMEKFTEKNNIMGKSIQDKIKGKSTGTHSHKVNTKPQPNEDKSNVATKDSSGNKMQKTMQQQTNKETITSKVDDDKAVKESQNNILSLKDKIYKNAANKVAKDIQVVGKDTKSEVKEKEIASTSAKPESKEQNTSKGNVDKATKRESINVLNESEAKINDTAKTVIDKQLKSTPSKTCSSKEEEKAKEHDNTKQSTEEKAIAKKTIEESKITEKSTDATVVVLDKEKKDSSDKDIRTKDAIVIVRNLRTRKEPEDKNNTTEKPETKTVPNIAKLQHHEKSHQQTNKRAQPTIAESSKIESESSDHEKTTEEKDGVSRRSLRKRVAEATTTATASTTPSAINDTIPAKKIFKEPSGNYETSKTESGGGCAAAIDENNIMSPKRNMRSPGMQNSSPLPKKPRLDLSRKLLRSRHNDSSSERENSESDTSSASKRSKTEVIDQSVKRESERKVQHKIATKEPHAENKTEPMIKEPAQAETKSEPKPKDPQSGTKSELKNKEALQSETNSEIKTKDLTPSEKISELKNKEPPQIENKTEPKSKEHALSVTKTKPQTTESIQSEKKAELKTAEAPQSEKKSNEEPKIESSSKQTKNDNAAESKPVENAKHEPKIEKEKEKEPKEPQVFKLRSSIKTKTNDVKKAAGTNEKQNEKATNVSATSASVEKEQQNARAKEETDEPLRKLPRLQVVKLKEDANRSSGSPSKTAIIEEKKDDDIKQQQQQTNQRRSLRTREPDASPDKGSVRKSLRTRVHADEKEKANASLLKVAEEKKLHEKSTKLTGEKKVTANVLNTTTTKTVAAAETTTTPTTKASAVETTPTRKSTKVSPTKSPGSQVMTFNEWLNRQKLIAEEKRVNESQAVQHDEDEIMTPVKPVTPITSVKRPMENEADEKLQSSGGGDGDAVNTENQNKTLPTDSTTPRTEDNATAKIVVKTPESKKKKLKDEIEILRQSMPKEMRDSGFEFATKNSRLRTAPKTLNALISTARGSPVKSVATVDSRKTAAKANVVAKTSERFKVPPVPEKPNVIDLPVDVNRILKDDHQQTASNRKLQPKSQIKATGVQNVGKISKTNKSQKLHVRINRHVVTSYFTKIKLNETQTKQENALSTDKSSTNNSDITVTTNKVPYTAGKILSEILAAVPSQSMPPPLAQKVVFSTSNSSSGIRTSTAKVGPANVLTIPLQNRRPPHTSSTLAQSTNDTTSETEDEYETQDLLLNEDMESYLLTPMKSSAVNETAVRKQQQFEKSKPIKVKAGAVGGGTQKHPGRYGTSTATAAGTYVPTPAAAVAASTTTAYRTDIPAIGTAFTLQQSSSLSSNAASETVFTSALEPKVEFEEDVESLLTPSRVGTSNTPAAAVAAAADFGITTAAAAASTTSSSQQLAQNAAAASMFGLTPPNIDSNGTRLYSFLHPAKYNRSHSHVLLDYCCPNLDGPMPAIDPTRIHAQVQTPVRELPAYIVMTTKLITRADLEGNNNTIPASIRQKVEKITSHASTGATGTLASVALAANTSTGALQPQPLSALITPPYLSALQKQLPASTVITPKQHPGVATITISKPGGGEVTQAVQSAMQNQQNENHRMAMRTYLRRIDANLKKLAVRFTTLSFAERQNLLEHICNTSAHAPKDYSSTARVLDEYLLKTNTALVASSVTQTIGLAATSSTSANISAHHLDKLHANAMKKFQSSSTRTAPAATSAAAQQKSSQYVPILDAEKNIIGYQIAASTVTASAFPSTSISSTLNSNTKSIMSTRANIMSTSAQAKRTIKAPANASTTSGTPTTAKISSLKQPIQDSPRIFYTNPSTMQTSTPIANTKNSSATAVAVNSSSVSSSSNLSASLRSTTRLGRDITIRQLNTTSLTTTTVTASPAAVAAATASKATEPVPVRLPTLIRNPNLASATSTTSTTKSAVTMATPPTLKRMTRKTAAAAAAKVIVITQDSNTTADECILPDDERLPQIKSEKDDEDFIGAS